MEQTSDTAIKILDSLSAHFGTTGAHLWEVMVKFQVTSSIVSLIGWGGFFSILALYLKTVADKNYDKNDNAIHYTLITCMFMVMFVAVTIIGIDLQGIFMPEYYALKDIAVMIRG
jgi:hypothetical protein